ncbi:MAG: nuclear transport factor 2 family protein [Saprospiraceae bacterium]|nr:nuclear transport factor 2 family protein [Saprospiraceae bacterium]
MVTNNVRLLVFIISYLGTGVTLAQSSQDSKILETESKRFAYMVAHDTAALRSMLSDDLVYVHSNAMKENKQEHLEAIGSGKVVYQSIKREEVKVRRYRKIAICNGVVLVKGVLNGNSFEINLLYSAVYQKIKGSWLLLNWQSTRRP